MEREVRLEQIKSTAEGYYQAGYLYCSEAVLKTINDALASPFDDDIIKLASGFPVGVGMAGCICGAISGGVMALGIVYGRKPGEKMGDFMLPACQKLHDHIKMLYKSTCCRVMIKNFDFASQERKNHCIGITGEVAKFVATILIDEQKMELPN